MDILLKYDTAYGWMLICLNEFKIVYEFDDILLVACCTFCSQQRLGSDLVLFGHEQVIYVENVQQLASGYSAILAI